LDVNNEEFRTDILKGLSNPVQKSIPSKYLYDIKGSYLFEQITVQPEYYPTRTENSILEEYSTKILQDIPKEIILIEMGSGSSKKTKHLFNSILKRQDKLYYFPIDISFNFLDSVVTDLETRNQNIMVKGIPNDYINGIKDCNNILFENNFKFDSFSRLIVFFGSSIGNFEIDEARDFLKAVRINMNDKDFLLVGFDMIKDEFLIESAFLCIVGGLIGLTLVFVLTKILSTVFNFPIFISTDNMVLAIIICIAVGILAGFIPARQASRLDPVVAIRS